MMNISGLLTSLGSCSGLHRLRKAWGFAWSLRLGWLLFTRILIMVLSFSCFSFLLYFSPLFVIDAYAQTATNDPCDPCGPPPCPRVCLFSTPTPMGETGVQCPDGTPVAWGTTTPSALWLLQCSDCVPNLTPTYAWPTMPAGPTLDPTLYPQPTGTSTVVPTAIPPPSRKLYAVTSDGTCSMSNNDRNALCQGSKIENMTSGVAVSATVWVRDANNNPAFDVPVYARLVADVIGGRITNFRGDHLYASGSVYVNLFTYSLDIRNTWHNWSWDGTVPHKSPVLELNARISVSTQWTSYSYQFYKETHYIYLFSLDEDFGASPTPTPTPDSICSEVNGGDGSGDGDDFPTLWLGPADCFEIPAIDGESLGLGGIPLIGPWIDAIDFDGVEFCAQEFGMTDLNFLGVTVDPNILLFIMAGALLFRIFMRS